MPHGPYKRQTHLRYVFEQANPEEGDWDELVRWISNEFSKIEQVSQSGILPGYGSLRINVGKVYNTTATPQLIAPYDSDDPEPIACVSDFTAGNITIDKDGTGVWSITMTAAFDTATANKTYNLELYINGLAVHLDVRAIAGTITEFNLTSTLQQTLHAGDVLELYIYSGTAATLTINSAHLVLTRIG